jgi:GNAT superfamily N-acetyltransferase
MTQVTLRRAATADSRAAADVWWRSRRAAMPAVPAPVHSDDEVRHHFETVLVPTRETWLAEADGVIVAVLVLHGTEVDQLYVDPDWQRGGIGSKLLRLAQDRRPDGLALWTFQSNLEARRFYERHGFVAVGWTDGLTNEERAPDVRYLWAGRPAAQRAQGRPSGHEP